MMPGKPRLRRLPKTLAMKPVTTHALAAFFLLIASAPQSVFARQELRPHVSYLIRVGPIHTLTYVVGATRAPARVTLDIPAGWAIASGLDTTNDPKTFSARSVELLLDSPIVVGQFRRWDFAVNGVPHTVVYLPQPNF